MKYKVIGFTNTEYPKYFESDLDVAVVIKEEFGLPHSLEDIVNIWKNYNGTMSLIEFEMERYCIEDAFGVILAPLGHKFND